VIEKKFQGRREAGGAQVRVIWGGVGVDNIYYKAEIDRIQEDDKKTDPGVRGETG